MNLQSSDDSESRFAAYVEGLVSVIGHSDRAGPLRDYCVGLVMAGERKSVEPMAAVTAPDRTAAQHQSLLHFVGQSPWSDEKVLAKVGEMVLPTIERHGPIEAWIVDDTGFPKKGDALGRRDATILWPGWQAGELPSCGVSVACQSARESASGLPLVRAGGLGGRQKTPTQDGSA
jgi:SRSO17 transposase